MSESTAAKAEFAGEIVLPILKQPVLKYVSCSSCAGRYATTETGYYCTSCGEMGWWTLNDFYGD